MKRILQTLTVITIALLVPILPFVIWGDVLERGLERFLRSEQTATWTAVAVVATLGTDVFLPVPSSVVSTVAGARLGVFAGALAAWAGMSLGAVLGFGLARRWGRPLAERMLGAPQWQLDEQVGGRYGTVLLVATRAIPVMSEAMVLLAGMHRMRWRTFLPPVLLSHAGIALGYTLLGHFAAEQHWLPIALGLAAAGPLALPPLMSAWLRRQSTAPTS